VSTPNVQSAQRLPSVSIILPAYNEGMILQKSLRILCDYMKTLESQYRWEIVLVNDGSKDETGPLAQEFARANPHVGVLHHPSNFGMGQALISAFRHCRSDYFVTLDLDLSFSPEHIGKLLHCLQESHAKIVIASPFMPGGAISNVPFKRKVMTIIANYLLARSSQLSVTSVTGIGRAYDGRFIRALSLKSTGMDINAEILYKAVLLRARVLEIPAHLDWAFQLKEGPQRRSSMRVRRQMLAVLMATFLFRPVHFFLLPGLVLFLFAGYVNVWMLVHWWNEFEKLGQYTWFLDRASEAVRIAYLAHPHTFFVGGLALVLAIQLLSLGFVSFQHKRNFEEMFHLGSSISQRLHEGEDEK